MLYKPTNGNFNDDNTIDAKDSNYYYVQTNVKGGSIWGYALTIYDKNGNIVYNDPKMIPYTSGVGDGQIIAIPIESNILENNEDYEISVRLYDQPQGVKDIPYATEITKAKIKGSTKTMLWTKVSLDSELENIIRGTITEYINKEISEQSYDYRREIAIMLVDGLLGDYSNQIRNSVIDILVNLETIDNLEPYINTVLESRRKEIIDNIKYDRYVQIDISMDDYPKRLIVTPEEKQNGVTLPKIEKFTERRKITWTQQYDDWLYIELDLSGINDETKGFTYSLTDQSEINIYSVSGENTFDSFFVDLEIAKNTIDIGNYILFYTSPEQALAAHQKGDLPGSTYKVTPVYKDAYKVIGVDVYTGEIRLEGILPQKPKVGYVPRVFEYDTLTETYTEKRPGKEKKGYKVLATSPYYDTQGGLDGKYMYNAWDEPTSPSEPFNKYIKVPYEEESINYLFDGARSYGPYKNRVTLGETYIITYAQDNTSTWVEYSSPSPFKVETYHCESSGAAKGFSGLDTNYIFYYSVDGGANFIPVTTSSYQITIEAVQQESGLYTICFRGSGETGWYRSETYNFLEIISDYSNISIKGNLDYLWDYENVPINHTQVEYASKLFYRQQAIVDVSGIVYPSIKTTNWNKEMFFHCGNIQKYPRNIVVYTNPKEALANFTGATSVQIRTNASTSNTVYTEVKYSDKNVTEKFEALSDKNTGLAFVDNKPYVYENLYEIADAQDYVFRTYNVNMATRDFSGTNLYEFLSYIKKDIAGAYELINLYYESQVQPYNQNPKSYYDCRCLHEKSSWSAQTGVIIAEGVAKFGDYYLKVPTDIDVVGFTPYYKDESCTQLLGETPRWFCGKGSRLSSYVGKIILEDETTAYIKLDTIFKIPVGTELYSDIQFKNFVKTVDYNKLDLAISIGSEFYEIAEELGTNVLEGIIDDHGIKYEITTTDILKNGIKLTDNSFNFTQLRYGCGKLFGLSNGSLYYSYDGITWTQQTQIWGTINKLFSAEDTIVCIVNNLVSDMIWYSHDGINFKNYMIYDVSDVAYAYGMFHFLAINKIYSTTNFIDWIDQDVVTATSICGSGFGLFVFRTNEFDYITQESKKNIVNTTVFTNPKVYSTKGEKVIINSGSDSYEFDGDAITALATPVGNRIHNNFNEYIKATYEETVNTVITEDTWVAVEADVVDYRTLRIGDKYFNNSTTMILKGPIVCKDGYVAGQEYYTIINEKLSVYNRSTFFPTPQRNIAVVGDPLYSDKEKTISTKTITIGCEYQIVDSSTSIVYDSNNIMIGYCDTPSTSPMIEDTPLYDDMDFTHSVGKYTPGYNVKCFLDIKEVTDTVPLATKSDMTENYYIEFKDESFSLVATILGEKTVVHGGVVSILGESIIGVTPPYEYHGFADLTLDYTNNLMRLYDCIGDWYFTQVGGTERIDLTYRYLVLETRERGDGNLDYIYHEIDQPSKCISGNLLNSHSLYMMSSDLKEYKSVEYPYREVKDSMLRTRANHILEGEDVIFNDEYILQNGIYKKSDKNSLCKYVQNGWLHLPQISYEIYYLNSNKWNYYNDDWATVYVDLGGEDSRYLYIGIPEAGTTDKDLNVYNVEYSVDGTPSKGYIYVDGNMYRVKGTSIIEDTTLTMVDVGNYQEQIVGGNPIEVVKNTKIESNNTNRLFITPNVNIKEDTTNPMQISFNNKEMFGVRKIEEFGDIVVIENNGVIPYDENENIYPGCDYSISTCFMDQDPTTRFSCKSKPDLKLVDMGGLGVNIKAEVRTDITQHLKPLTYQWTVTTTTFPTTTIYKEDIYNNNELHLNLVGGSYRINCTVNEVTTNYLDYTVSAEIDQTEPISPNETNLGYVILPNPTYPYIFKQRKPTGTISTFEKYSMEYLGYYNNIDQILIDFDVELGKEYYYILSDGNNNKIRYTASGLKADQFVITNLKETFEFKYNYTSGSTTLNIDQTNTDSLSKYGKVTVKDKWYHSGSVSTLLGYVSEEGYSEIEDLGESIDMLRRWKSFAASGDIFLLRNPKGEKYYIKITESPAYTPNDMTKIKETKIDFNWTEVETDKKFQEVIDLNYGLKFENAGGVRLVDGWKGEGSIEYSFNAIDWEKWDGSLLTGTNIYFRGKNNTGTNGSQFYTTTNDTFKLSGIFNNLLDYESSYWVNGDCHSLFEGTNIQDAGELIMGEYISGNGGYQNMFKNCTSLEILPQLPAMVVPEGCYTGMFSGCSSITWTSKGLEFSCGTNTDTMFAGCGFDEDSTMPSTGIPTTGQYYAYVPTRNKKFVTFFSDDSFSIAMNEGYIWGGEGYLEYSIDSYTWYRFNDLDTMYSSISTKKYNNKYELYIRGIDNTGTWINALTWIKINTPDVINIKGDFKHFLDYTKDINIGDCYALFKEQPIGDASGLIITFTENTFTNEFFYGCNKLTQPPIILGDIIGEKGMEYMFYSCTSLLRAPELPATSVGNRGYLGLFGKCTSIIEIPETLPATSVGEFGYYWMFNQCSNITTTPNILLKDVGSSTCDGMFNECNKLETTGTIGPFNSIEEYGCSGMFANCSQLRTVNLALNASEIFRYGCYNMFSNCSSLTTGVSISATVIRDYGCSQMYQYCTSLTTSGITQLKAVSPGKYAYNNMFYNCTSLTSAPEILMTTCSNSVCKNMFGYCKVLTTAPTLSATTLAVDCYYQMFIGCIALTVAPTLSVTTLANRCYMGMFSDCTSLTTPPALPATTLVDYCYYGMFKNCTSLTIARDININTIPQYACGYMYFNTAITICPNINATTIRDYGCYYMFSNCHNLTTLPISLPATTVGYSGYSFMFENCTNITSAIPMNITTINSSTCKAMYSGCSSLTTPCDFTNIVKINSYGCSNMFKGTAISIPAVFPTDIELGNNACEYMYSNCAKIIWYPYGTTYRISTSSSKIGINVFNSMFYNTTILGANSEINVSTPTINTNYYLFDESQTEYITIESNDGNPFDIRCYKAIYKLPTDTEWTKYPEGATTTVQDKIYIIANANGVQITVTNGQAKVSGYLHGLAGVRVTSNISKKLNGLFSNSTGLVDASGLNFGNALASGVDNMFKEMFYCCINLINGPSYIPPCANSKHCFENMFYSCTSLTSAPNIKIDLKNLAESTYRYMFYFCTSLSNSPSVTLVASGTYSIDIPTQCFEGMFTSCKITSDKIFEAFIGNGNNVTINNIGAKGFQLMYYNTKLTSTYFSLPNSSGSVGSAGCYSMFNKCSSLTNLNSMVLAPTTIYGNCYNQMFADCSEMTTGLSNLPATNLPEGCYTGMFSGCKKLTNTPTIASGNPVIVGDKVFANMFYNSAIKSTMIVNTTTIGYRAFAYTYQNCTSLTSIGSMANITSIGIEAFLCCFSNAKIPNKVILPNVTNMNEGCYKMMFYQANFDSVNYLPDLPCVNLATECYNYMFSGASKVTKPITLPATNMADRCYEGMFKNCGITWLASTATGYTPYKIPALTTLAYDWGLNMFQYNMASFPEANGTPVADKYYYYKSS